MAPTIRPAICAGRRGRALLAAQAEADAIQERERRRWNAARDYLAEQRRLILEKFPELADPARRRRSARKALTIPGLGFSDQEIGRVARSPYDAGDPRRRRPSQEPEGSQDGDGKKIADAPKLQRPGAAPSEAGNRRQDGAAITRIARHGTTDQQAEALARLIEKEN